MSQWIKCSDRLPDPAELVVIWYQGRCYFAELNKKECSNGTVLFWHIWNGKSMDDFTVDHELERLWMPLPPLPWEAQP